MKLLGDPNFGAVAGCGHGQHGTWPEAVQCVTGVAPDPFAMWLWGYSSDATGGRFALGARGLVEEAQRLGYYPVRHQPALPPRQSEALDSYTATL